LKIKPLQRLHLSRKGVQNNGHRRD
jgi:hypothetical protein